MYPVNDWFFEWLEYHQMLHPHRGWMRGENPNALEFYAGWIACFEGIGVTLDVARQASRNLQEDPPKFLNEQLPRLKTAIFGIKSLAATTPTGGVQHPNPEQVRASIESHGCPECEGTGWARRHAYWPSLRWSPCVDMFCRCPHGRWRKANDPDLRTPDGRNYDDLQAWPSIWNPDLAFHLWTDRPVKPESIADPETERLWHYLPPGQSVPGQSSFRPLTATIAVS